MHLRLRCKQCLQLWPAVSSSASASFLMRCGGCKKKIPLKQLRWGSGLCDACYNKSCNSAADVGRCCKCCTNSQMHLTHKTPEPGRLPGAARAVPLEAREQNKSAAKAWSAGCAERPLVSLLHYVRHYASSPHSDLCLALAPLRHSAGQAFL